MVVSRFLELAHQQIRAQQSDKQGDEDSPQGYSLQFQNMEMQEIPPELLEVLNDEVLKLSFNHNLLRSVPPLPSLSRLFYLDLSGNYLTHVPPAICELRSLEILDLSENQITRLPRELANLQSLKVLSLSHNRLQYLSSVLATLKCLEYMEVDDNPLTFPGPAILQLAQDQDDWLPALRQHLLENQDKIKQIEQNLDQQSAVSHEPAHLERSRSSSEGYTNQRSKRMGFVMQRNASGRLYMAGLHSRGLSVDSSMAETSLPDPQVGSPLVASDWAISDATPQTVSRSDSAVSLSPPLAVNTTGMPTEDDSDKELPSASSDSAPNRLFTLPEEEDDSEALPRPAPSASLAPQNPQAAPPAPPAPAPAVPQKSQNRSRVNSAADSVRPPHRGYRKLLAALTCFLDAVVDCMPSSSPRFSALTTGCRSAVQALEQAVQSDRDIGGAAHAAVASAQELVAYLSAPQVLEQVVHSRIEGVRTLILQLVHSFADLSNANREFSTPTPPPMPATHTTSSTSDLRSVQSSAKLAHADEQLYLQLDHAVKTLQIVVSLFNAAIAQSATASAVENGAGAVSSSENAGLAAYVGELSGACIECVASMRQLKIALDNRRERGIMDRRAFWDDVNLFLKSIVSLLAAAKSAVVDLPLLADSGAEMSTLARVAKEVPPLLEQSSYKLHLDAGARLERPRIPSAPQQGPPSGSPVPAATTPFIASLGTAAQELLSPGLQTPFEDRPM